MKAIHNAAIAALILIFLVILAGSVVRMTGSGMGCPDWPKCYGFLVPPTDEEQVVWHANHAYIKGQMIVKDEALWTAKEDFTSNNTYNSAHWEEYTQHDYAIFNPLHTWIEYVNRLLGALSGIPVLLLFVLSLFKIRSKPILFFLSTAVLVMLGYEAWLGKLVVDGNLVPNAITKHMFGSLLIVALLVVINFISGDRKKIEVSKTYKVLLLFGFVLLVAQILLGTQVREQIDEIALDHSNRTTWIDLLDVKVLVHRSFSLAIFFLGVLLFWRNWKNEYNLSSVGTFAVLVTLEIIAGIVLFYFDVPSFMQPIHLLLSTAMFALLVWAVIRTRVVR